MLQNLKQLACIGASRQLLFLVPDLMFLSFCKKHAEVKKFKIPMNCPEASPSGCTPLHIECLFPGAYLLHMSPLLAAATLS